MAVPSGKAFLIQCSIWLSNARRQPLTTFQRKVR